MNRASIFAAATVGAGMVVMTPAVANAQTDVAANVPGGVCGGPYASAFASFTANGEILKAYDNCPDGHSAVNEYKIGSASVKRLWDHSGAGGADPAVLDASIAEGVKVQIRACTGEYGNGSLLQCFSWRTGVA